ncbi:hypothetical protein LIER_20145 [Lithospermum erythrorhizon]|uniref:Uncharacterized protein n=1 Tax=Lithospermum erythrorhizon TaxID=34254 RepID=A0AAV3QP08_LITER
MRDRMERFVFLPFTMGCVSESSIGVGTPQYRRSNMGFVSESSIGVGTMQYRRSKESTPTRKPQEEKDEVVDYEDDYEECYSKENLKNPLSIMSLPKFERLLKNFKSISHIFEYKDEMDEPEVEMEIGLPTDRTPISYEIPSLPPNRYGLRMATKAEMLDIPRP